MNKFTAEIFIKHSPKFNGHGPATNSSTRVHHIFYLPKKFGIFFFSFSSDLIDICQMETMINCCEYTFSIINSSLDGRVSIT